MEIVGKLRCAHCDSSLIKPTSAAYGLGDESVACPHCGAVFNIETTVEEGRVAFALKQTNGFQLPVVAVIGNPHNPHQGFQFVPLRLPLPKAIPFGINPLDNFVDYTNLVEAAFEAMLASKYMTIYGIDSVPRLVCILPQEFYRNLNHRNSVLLVDMLRHGAGFTEGWLKAVLKDKAKSSLPIGCAVALSMLHFAPYFAHIVDSYMGEKIQIGYEEGIPIGLLYANRQIHLQRFDMTVNSPLEAAKLLTTDKDAYLAKLKTYAKNERMKNAKR